MKFQKKLQLMRRMEYQKIIFFRQCIKPTIQIYNIKLGWNK